MERPIRPAKRGGSPLPSSRGRARLTPFCEPFGNCRIRALRPWMISMPPLLPHGCQCATRAPSTGGHGGDLSAGHKRDQRLDEGGPDCGPPTVDDVSRREIPLSEKLPQSMIEDQWGL